MKPDHKITGAAPTHMGLTVDFEAPGRTMKSAERKMRELGNPIVEVQGKTITAVSQVEGILYDHSEAAQGEIVWKCDRCHCYSRSEAVVLDHEKTCERIEGSSAS